MDAIIKLGPDCRFCKITDRNGVVIDVPIRKVEISLEADGLATAVITLCGVQVEAECAGATFLQPLESLAGKGDTPQLALADLLAKTNGRAV